MLPVLTCCGAAGHAALAMLCCRALLLQVHPLDPEELEARRHRPRRGGFRGRWGRVGQGLGQRQGRTEGTQCHRRLHGCEARQPLWWEGAAAGHAGLVVDAVTVAAAHRGALAVAAALICSSHGSWSAP